MGWQNQAKSEEYVKAWVKTRKLNQRVEDLQPGSWFNEQWTEWDKLLQNWKKVHASAKDTANKKKVEKKKKPVAKEDTTDEKTAETGKEDTKEEDKKDDSEKAEKVGDGENEK